MFACVVHVRIECTHPHPHKNTHISTKMHGMHTYNEMFSQQFSELFSVLSNISIPFYCIHVSTRSSWHIRSWICHLALEKCTQPEHASSTHELASCTRNLAPAFLIHLRVSPMNDIYLFEHSLTRLAPVIRNLVITALASSTWSPSPKTHTRTHPPPTHSIKHVSLHRQTRTAHARAYCAWMTWTIPSSNTAACGKVETMVMAPGMPLILSISVILRKRGEGWRKETKTPSNSEKVHSAHAHAGNDVAELCPCVWALPHTLLSF